MALYTVTYQLNKKGQDYQVLWDEFDRLGAHKVMRSVYFVELTTNSAVAVKDHFRDFVDENDFLCVIPMNSKPSKFICFQGTQDWIDEHF